MIVDPGDALAEFQRLVQPDVCPTLSEEEQHLILDRHIRGYLWVANTAIQLGTKIIPTLANRNGCRYKAVEYTATGTDQKTGATEPTWSTTRDAQIADNHVIWQEDGWDWDGALWDLNAAACAAWELKAGKSVGRVDFETQNMSVDASQLYEHCIAQAKRFQSSYCL